MEAHQLRAAPGSSTLCQDPGPHGMGTSLVMKEKRCCPKNKKGILDERFKPYVVQGLSLRSSLLKTLRVVIPS